MLVFFYVFFYRTFPLCVRRQVFPLKVFVTQWITTHSVWNISVFSAICWWVFPPFCCVGIFCNWQTTKCVQRHLATSFSNEYFYLANSLPRNQTNAPIAILQKLSHAIWGEHLKTHSGENSNNCTNCNFPSFEGISLRRHMNMHNGGKPHKCNHCSYTNTRHAIWESI